MWHTRQGQKDVFFKSEHWSRPSIPRQKKRIINKQKPCLCGRRGGKKREEYNYDMEAERREKNGPKNIIVQNERESWFLKQKPVTPDIIVRQKKKEKSADLLKSYTTRPKAK